MTMRSLGIIQLTSQGDRTTYYASDRRVEIYFKDYRDIEIIFEKQEEDIQIEGK